MQTPAVISWLVCMWCEWRATLYLPISLSVPARLAVRVPPCFLVSGMLSRFPEWLKTLEGKKKTLCTVVIFSKRSFKVRRQGIYFCLSSWAWLISVLLKIHSLIIPPLPTPNAFLSISLPLSPSVERSFSQWYLCFFVSVHFTLLAWGVIHCLYLSLFALSLLSFCVSFPLFPRSSKICHGSETEERLLFLWHTLPLLNQNQLRRNQVITLAVFLLSPSHPFFHFCPRSMKFYTLKWKGSRSVRRMGASWIWKEIAA